MEENLKENPINEGLLLEAVHGDTGLVQEFREFRSKDLHRKRRRAIEVQTQEIIRTDDEIATEYEDAVERMNEVYRKAWSKACIDLGLKEMDYPSKY